jgi:hypothetical protein
MSPLDQPDGRRGDRSATKVRAVRVSDDLWEAAQARAAENGESLSDVIRRALIAYTGLQGTTGVVGRVDRQ